MLFECELIKRILDLYYIIIYHEVLKIIIKRFEELEEIEKIVLLLL
jgi:hypothetical protein